MKRLLTGVLVILMACITHPVFGGDLDPPGPPSEGSGMPTLQDIYNYLNSGTLPPTPGTFKEPSAGPDPTMKTTKEIYEVIKEKFEQLDAQTSNVEAGKKFFSTETGNWGVKPGSAVVSSGDASEADVLNGKTFSNATANGLTGTLVCPSPATGTGDQTVAAGYWSSANTVSGDSALVTGNIRAGTTI